MRVTATGLVIVLVILNELTLALIVAMIAFLLGPGSYQTPTQEDEERERN